MNFSFFKKKNENKLYRLEILATCGILLCFVISAFALPALKDVVPLEVMAGEKLASTVGELDSSDDIESGISLKGIKGSKNSDSDGSSSRTTKKQVAVSGNAGHQSDAASSHGSSGSGSSGSSTGSGKTWVPPVYKTVHHKAVYQTVKRYVCNYCGAKFDTSGLFQVHKDEHGG